MKKTIIGSSLLLSGVILFSGIAIVGAINLQRISGWSFWLSIRDFSMVVPFILSIILSISGLTILLLELFNTDLKTFVDNINKKMEKW